MRKLRIMYLSHERKMGGANLCLLEMAREMKRRGHEVIVVVLLQKCPLADELRKNGIRVIPAFFGWWQMPAKWNVFLKTAFSVLYYLEFLQVKRLARIAQREKIDIIHSNSSCIDIGVKIAQRAKIPHVWHFREFGMPDYELEYLKGRKTSIAYINENAENIIFISQALRKYYGDILDDGCRQVIYDGISDEHLSEDGYLQSGAVTFLVAGNLSKNKNQRIVLEAARILQERKIGNFRVLLAGAASSLKESRQYEEDLKQYTETHGLWQVKFLGYVKDMERIRKISDVGIIPSVCEAFGRVTVEAMLSGRPVIVSDSGANQELVANQKDGLIFRQGNAEELAARMQYFIEHPEKLQEFGQNAREHASQAYLLKYNIDNIEHLYQKIRKDI